MKNLVPILLLIICLGGCELTDNEPVGRLCRIVPEVPVVNVPVGDRCQNYAGGSCVHASTVMMLRWQERYSIADDWRKKYSGGEYMKDYIDKLSDNKLAYAYTTSGDMGFIEWCIRTRRGANIVWMGGRHMLCLVDLLPDKAGVLDNNQTDEIKWIDRKRFESEWLESGGFALTLLYSPAAPLAVR